MKIHHARDGRVIFQNAAACGRLLRNTGCDRLQLLVIKHLDG